MGLIAVTSGDPCGIGPEVALKALKVTSRRTSAGLVVIGDLAVFEEAAGRLRQRLPAWRVVRSFENWLDCEPRSGTGRVLAGPAAGRPLAGPSARCGSSRSVASPRHPPRKMAQYPGLAFLDCAHHARFVPGRPSAAAGRASLAYLERALDLWRSGCVQALVTGPVTKWSIRLSTPSFVGQTEYLARATGSRAVVMMFASERLRVALLTRHVPLRRVAAAITTPLVRSTVRLTAEALRSQFGIRTPRLAICGVNPHAGEGGRSDGEESAVMQPALRALRREGIRCDGPLAADGLFASAANYDAIICAYHDQGLIPFKMGARDRGCQLTLGLPFVRTSPDHGSALDIAGRGIAEPGSMVYALRLARRLSCQHTAVSTRQTARSRPNLQSAIRNSQFAVRRNAPPRTC